VIRLEQHKSVALVTFGALPSVIKNLEKGIADKFDATSPIFNIEFRSSKSSAYTGETIIPLL
jgi:hypothetical protein